MAPKNLIFTVGLEIHARLRTDHKIFCGCANRYGDEPNRHTCAVCLGLPGSLPVLNPEVLQPALKAALALGCHLPRVSEFSRKNYFYPDLPRNYQITQYDRPLAVHGSLQAHPEENSPVVRLERIHLEEDAGRSLHLPDGTTGVDLNRAGTPLIEIVTRPDLAHGGQARTWLNRLRQILRVLEVCDGDMETGSLRCDANVGLSEDSDWAGPWVELKNLNSFKAVSGAIDFEIQRLGQLLEEGHTLERETRAWDPKLRQTTLLRKKEDSAEYRFFPEPDLPTLVIPSSLVERVRENLPELPMARESRWLRTWNLGPDDAGTLCRSVALADYFEACAEHLSLGLGQATEVSGPLAANWVLSIILAEIKGRDHELVHFSLSPQDLAQVIDAVHNQEISSTVGRQLVARVLDGETLVEAVAAAKNEGRGTGDLAAVCRDILVENPARVKEYREGKTGLLNFFLGQILSRHSGSLDPQKVRESLLAELDRQPE